MKSKTRHISQSAAFKELNKFLYLDDVLWDLDGESIHRKSGLTMQHQPSASIAAQLRKKGLV